MDTVTLGMILTGLGVSLVVFGKLINQAVRAVVDYKLGNKEREADEAAKNSAIALDKYRDAKRKYDENK